jgi:hypothetical protein
MIDIPSSCVGGLCTRAVDANPVSHAKVGSVAASFRYVGVICALPVIESMAPADLLCSNVTLRQAFPRRPTEVLCFLNPVTSFCMFVLVF